MDNDEIVYRRHPNFPNRVFELITNKEAIANDFERRKVINSYFIRLSTDFDHLNSVRFHNFHCVLQKQLYDILFPTLKIIFRRSSKFLASLSKNGPTIYLVKRLLIFDIKLPTEYDGDNYVRPFLSENDVIHPMGFVSFRDLPDNFTNFIGLKYVERWSLTLSRMSIIPKIKRFHFLPKLYIYLGEKGAPHVLQNIDDYRVLIKAISCLTELQDLAFYYIDFPIEWEAVLSECLTNPKLKHNEIEQDVTSIKLGPQLH